MHVHEGTSSHRISDWALRSIFALSLLWFTLAFAPGPRENRDLIPNKVRTSDLLITGIIDGPLSGGTPKAIELYVVNDIPDLSIYGLGAANNGGGTDGEEFSFPNDAASAGDFIYVATETTEFQNWFGFAPDYTDGSAPNINGDDAIELFLSGTVVDVFGDINVDGSGQPWDYVDGWAYREDATGPDGASFSLASWSFSGTDALDGATTNGSASTPFPTGTYTPSQNQGGALPSIIINEVDADTPGTDSAEFIELYDGGTGNVSLDGLVLVAYDGDSDTSYNLGGQANAIDLDGHSTNDDGFFVIGNTALSPGFTFGDNTLQNGADAVALYNADGTDFPGGTSVTTANLIDALVYDSDDADDAGLLTLLNAGQAQINENDNSAAESHSLQRLPNGSGGARATETYFPIPPTPGAINEAPLPGIVINEFVANHVNTDTDEFVEVFGAPLTDYSGLTLLEIEGDGGSSQGVIDGVFPIGSTDANGFWTTGFLNNELENGTLTLLLVEGFSGSTGDDIDTDDNGTTDASPPWTLLIDAIAIDDGGGFDLTYSEVVLAAGFDGNGATPGGGSRLPNGVDTNAIDDWLRNDMDGEGLPSFPDGGTPKNGEAINTPGQVNLEGATPPAPDGLIINEVDADTPGSDIAEFIELFDGGVGNTPLDNVVVVFYNGSSDQVYRAVDLDGFTTNEAGFFLLGSASLTPAPDFVLPNSSLQNGADAVALFAGEAADFPNGTPLTTELLVDALVYDTDDADDAGLLQLLNAGQPQINENEEDNKDGHSMQRLPNGSGGERNSNTYRVITPTPGSINGGADLELSKSVDDFDDDGSSISAVFLLRLINHGPDIASGVQVTDLLPEGMDFIGANVSQGVYDHASGEWDVGIIEVGEVETLEIHVAADSGSELENVAEITAANEADPDSTPGDGTGDDRSRARLVDPQRAWPDLSKYQADLSLSQSMSPEVVSSGESISIVISVTNHGPYPTSGVKVKSLLPAGLSHDSNTGDGTYDVSSGIWTIGHLNRQEVARLTITTFAGGSGTVSNTAEIIASNLPDPDSSTNNQVEDEDDQDTRSLEIQGGGKATSSMEGTSKEIPDDFELGPNYPNPFNPSTQIPYGLPQREHVNISVYNLLGRMVEVLVDDQLAAGRHTVNWHASTFPSGIYLVRLRASSHILTRRITLMK